MKYKALEAAVLRTVAWFFDICCAGLVDILVAFRSFCVVNRTICGCLSRSVYDRGNIPLRFFFIQPDDRIKILEDKIKLLEQEKTVENCANALLALRRHLNRPPSLFDRFESVELLETIVRLARTQAHQKADEYAAALDEVKARQPSLDADHLQRLMLGLVGDPLRAKMAKEATSILKGMSKTPSTSSQGRRPLRQSTPYSVQCYACGGWGHIARNCKSRRGGGPGRGRGRQ